MKKRQWDWTGDNFISLLQASDNRAEWEQHVFKLRQAVDAAEIEKEKSLRVQYTKFVNIQVILYKYSTYIQIFGEK